LPTRALQTLAPLFPWLSSIDPAAAAAALPLPRRAGARTPPPLLVSPVPRHHRCLPQRAIGSSRAGQIPQVHRLQLHHHLVASPIAVLLFALGWPAARWRRRPQQRHLRLPRRHVQVWISTDSSVNDLLGLEDLEDDSSTHFCSEAPKSNYLPPVVNTDRPQ
ncbi:unnamed protein product, partial [Urochloa humidicola]